VATYKRAKLFGIGIVLGVSMFLVGGLREPAHSPQAEPTALLAPWLQKTECDYPAVDCTSRGSVVTSPGRAGSPDQSAR
jgi:hypothetical protein